ncbi:uncharacterized protein V2V93DRAFT_228296 [Kockiozyma suomiensis]|uniref:uncharacterized protein n=1 Tax=Kockiozyma suomiensis TaxID=1337062 RepID=UPI00334436BA
MMSLPNQSIEQQIAALRQELEGLRKVNDKYQRGFVKFVEKTKQKVPSLTIPSKLDFNITNLKIIADKHPVSNSADTQPVENSADIQPARKCLPYLRNSLRLKPTKKQSIMDFLLHLRACVEFGKALTGGSVYQFQLNDSWTEWEVNNVNTEYPPVGIVALFWPIFVVLWLIQMLLYTIYELRIFWDTSKSFDPIGRRFVLQKGKNDDKIFSKFILLLRYGLNLIEKDDPANFNYRFAWKLGTGYAVPFVRIDRRDIFAHFRKLDDSSRQIVKGNLLRMEQSFKHSQAVEFRQIKDQWASIGRMYSLTDSPVQKFVRYGVTKYQLLPHDDSINEIMESLYEGVENGNQIVKNQFINRKLIHHLEKTLYDGKLNSELSMKPSSAQSVSRTSSLADTLITAAHKISSMADSIDSMVDTFGARVKALFYETPTYSSNLRRLEILLGEEKEQSPNGPSTLCCLMCAIAFNSLPMVPKLPSDIKLTSMEVMSYVGLQEKLEMLDRLFNPDSEQWKDAEYLKWGGVVPIFQPQPPESPEAPHSSLNSHNQIYIPIGNSVDKKYWQIQTLQAIDKLSDKLKPYISDVLRNLSKQTSVEDAKQQLAKFSISDFLNQLDPKSRRAVLRKPLINQMRAVGFVFQKPRRTVHSTRFPNTKFEEFLSGIMPNMIHPLSVSWSAVSGLISGFSIRTDTNSMSKAAKFFSILSLYFSVVINIGFTGTQWFLFGAGYKSMNFIPIPHRNIGSIGRKIFDTPGTLLARQRYVLTSYIEGSDPDFLLDDLSGLTPDANVVKNPLMAVTCWRVHDSVIESIGFRFSDTQYLLPTSPKNLLVEKIENSRTRQYWKIIRIFLEIFIGTIRDNSKQYHNELLDKNRGERETSGKTKFQRSYRLPYGKWPVESTQSHLESKTKSGHITITIDC